jgi:hypothetical protein
MVLVMCDGYSLLSPSSASATVINWQLRRAFPLLYQLS